MRFVAIATCTLLAGCQGSDLQCDNPTFVAGIRKLLNQNNNTLYYRGYALYEEANRSNLPTSKEIDRQMADLKAALQKAKSICPKQQISAMVCEDMSMYPTLESFSQINYNGSRPVTPAEIEVYRTNFLPIFDHLNQLQKQKAGDRGYIQQKESELRSSFNATVRYEVGLFRLKARNDQSGAVACEAQVTVNTSTGSWSKEVLYSLEKTTDGGLYYRIHSQL